MLQHKVSKLKIKAFLHLRCLPKLFINLYSKNHLRVLNMTDKKLI